MRSSVRLTLAAVAVLVLNWAVPASETDLTDYRTVDKAIAGKIARTESTTVPVQAFLGVEVALDANGRLLVQAVATASPAAKAGMQRGDQILEVDGTPVKDDAAFYEWLRERGPGEQVKLALTRDGKMTLAKATLTPLSRPVVQGRQQAFLGVLVSKTIEGQGLAIEQVAPDSPAAKANLKVGDTILKIDNVPLPNPDKLSELIAAKKPGDSLTLTLGPPDKTTEKKVILATELISDKKSGSWDTRAGGAGWKKPFYRLAVICIEYPDEKHNPKITSKDWEESLYSKGTYTKTSATGQPVYGSVNDLYLEQSYGKLRIEGKVFDFVEVPKKRNDYATLKQALLTDATDKLLAREGKDALSTFDGVFFLFAGTLPQGTKRGGGSLYWPHRGSFTYQGKRWPYFICPEGGQKMANISVFAHEFGHMLSLPDLYARPEMPGLEGLGQWCLMSNQVGNGRPQHASAWCKEKCGWIEPTVLDPTVKQKLILAPIQDSSKECFKVLIHRDASEYLLLENRAKKGFDKSLGGEGLLIWRVVRGQPVLEESHGVEGQAGPNVFLASVPYPSGANDSFTPYTTPSSRSKQGGGLPVHITNIRRLPDGRITFHIGYEYQ